MPFWKSYWFQDRNRPNTEFLYYFYDKTIILVVIIVVNLSFLSFFLIKIKRFVNSFPESSSLEDIWLIIPLVLLLFIGFPRIKNLYIHEEFNECDLNIKVFGHQWYWSYEIINNNHEIDCFIKNESFNFRLLETFNHLILPVKCIVRFLVSSDDVIHSWALPSLGIKIDAVPGRISQNLSIINRPGVIIGQCREICGSNHSFIPIFISATSLKNFN